MSDQPIEVTPEMIDAGQAALERWLDQFEGFEGWPGNDQERALVATVLESSLPMIFSLRR
jgi:hypothetical protein